jgi:hypothetical protein
MPIREMAIAAGKRAPCIDRQGERVANTVAGMHLAMHQRWKDIIRCQIPLLNTMLCVGVDTGT